MPSAREFAFIGCRLLALYFLYGVLLQVPSSVAALNVAFGSNGPSDILALFYPGRHLLPIVYLLIGLTLSWVLWIGAGRISAMITTGMRPSQDENGLGWSPEIILSLGIVVLGFWLLAHHLPTVVYYIFTIQQVSKTDQGASVDYLIANFIGECLKVAFGVACILGASAIARTINRLRRW